jgi:menaquinone-dependent protoporphyrinogen oxidase
MSRILVLYASHYGQTRAIAQRLAALLIGRGHDVDVVDAKLGLRHSPPPDAYDAVVLGSRVELGHHADDITAYVLAHLEKLEHKPTAFFSVSMAAAKPSAGPDPNGYMRTLFEDLKWKPRCFAAFAGGLPYRKYGWIMRFIMKRISRSAGHTTDTSRDHELTDWNSVDRFADTIAALAPGEAPGVHGV